MGEDVSVSHLGFSGIHFRYWKYPKVLGLSVTRHGYDVLVGDVITVLFESGESSAPTTAVTWITVLCIRNPVVAHEHILCMLHPRCLRMLDAIMYMISLFCTFSVFVTTTTVEDKEGPFSTY